MIEKSIFEPYFKNVLNYRLSILKLFWNIVKISSKFPNPLILKLSYVHLLLKNIYIVVPILFRKPMIDFLELIDNQFFLAIFDSIDFLKESIIDQIQLLILKK